MLQVYLVKTRGARPEKSLMAPSRTSTTAFVLVKSILLGVMVMRLIRISALMMIRMIMMIEMIVVTEEAFLTHTAIKGYSYI